MNENTHETTKSAELTTPGRFSKEERVCIAHALHHLMANKIADPTTFSGWYSGDKRVFVKRHKKAIEVLNGFLVEHINAKHASESELETES